MNYTQLLQKEGYRLTPQRMMVFDALNSVEGHVSVEEIYTQVQARYPYANISTIYRTLELLKELGLVTEIDIGDGRIRYHPLEKGRHHHLVCTNCGKMMDLPESIINPLETVLARDYHFRADLKHLAVFGLCADCQK